MRNPEPPVSAKTAFTLLLLIHTTNALSFIPDPRVSSIRPLVTTLSLNQSPAPILPIDPDPLSTRYVSTTKRAAANKMRITTPSGAAAAAADDDDDDGGVVSDTKKGEIIINCRTNEEEEQHNNDNHNNNNDNTTALPIIQIFPDGSYSTFTPEETKEFNILRTAQGEGPDLRDPPLEHPAPLGIDQTPKPSREPSTYDRSRTCASSGEWCPLPREGVTLLAGTGIGSCIYFREDGFWGKTITYRAC